MKTLIAITLLMMTATSFAAETCSCEDQENALINLANEKNEGRLDIALNALMVTIPFEGFNKSYKTENDSHTETDSAFPSSLDDFKMSGTIKCGKLSKKGNWYNLGGSGSYGYSFIERLSSKKVQASYKMDSSCKEVTEYYPGGLDQYQN